MKGRPIPPRKGYARATRRKRDFERAVPINLTLTPALVPVLERVVKEGGFAGPVDYFRARVRLDGGLNLTISLDHGQDTKESHA